MSGKMLILLGLLAGSAYALTRATPPVPPGATAADSMAVAQAGVGARFEYGLGSLGSKIVSSTVRGMVRETERSLADLGAAIKSAKGSDGVRAKKFAAEVARMDSTALIDLEYGHPIKAVKGALEAKSVLNAVRNQVDRKI
ncbi:MAG: hypothetical protein ACT443_13470 [Gemmatimonadota bacterium]